MSDALRVDENYYTKKRTYTYADYLEWEGPERYQLFNGEVYQMASPSVEHQAILMGLSIQFGNWLKGKPCRVFASPLDVRLFPKRDKSDRTVVQPDLMVVCDKTKIAKSSIDGAPDLVIEIVSPSNTHSELFLKFQYYMKAGVKEYWVIDPERKNVQVHIYENGRYITSLYEDNARIPVIVLAGLEVDIEALWEKI